MYGETVIESHNLLKNGKGITDYILVTEDYVKALNQNISDLLVAETEYPSSKSESYSGFKKIAYYFFSTVKKASMLSSIISKKTKFLNDETYLAVGTSTFIKS